MKRSITPMMNSLFTGLLAVILAFGVLAGDVAKSQSRPQGTIQVTENLLQSVKVSTDLVDLLLQGKLTDRAEVTASMEGLQTTGANQLIVSCRTLSTWP